MCSVSLYETRRSNNQIIRSEVDHHYHFHLSRLNMISWSRHLQVQHPMIDQKIHFSENDILSLVGHPLQYLYFDECSGYSTALESYRVQFVSDLQSKRLLQMILRIVLSFLCQCFKKIHDVSRFETSKLRPQRFNPLVCMR